jgi:hypothetical protein
MKALFKKIFGEPDVTIAQPEAPTADARLCSLELFFAEDGEVFRTEKQRNEYEHGLIIKALIEMMDRHDSESKFLLFYGVRISKVATYVLENFDEINAIVKRNK